MGGDVADNNAGMSGEPIGLAQPDQAPTPILRPPVYEDRAVTVYLGDAREVMAGLPAESVDCVITSPPY